LKSSFGEKTIHIGIIHIAGWMYNHIAWVVNIGREIIIHTYVLNITL